jgi:hypothetical protein
MIRIKHSVIAIVASCVATIALADPDKDEKRDGRWREQKQERYDSDEHGKRDEWRHGHRDHGGHSQVNVPPGHLPPPGECRIWFPDRPAGHQPPPGDCRELSRKVPRGAVLVEGG